MGWTDGRKGDIIEMAARVGLGLALWKIAGKANKREGGARRETLEAAVIRRARLGGSKIAVAESCTGGLLGGRLSSVVGGSDVFLGGVISYQNEVKTAVLGVREKDLEKYSAVSNPVARQMALGVKEKFGAGIGVSVTGYAGPQVGTEPVGVVYIGVCADKNIVRKYRFSGKRESVREQAVEAALKLVLEVMDLGSQE